MHHAHIDRFSFGDSPIHRLDSRVKFIVAVVFTALVVSLPRSSPAILACYAVGPFTVLVLARIPLRFVFKHILLVSPFVLVLALTCPLYDRTPVTVMFGPISGQISLGWVVGQVAVAGQLFQRGSRATTATRPAARRPPPGQPGHRACLTPIIESFFPTSHVTRNRPSGRHFARALANLRPKQTA